MLHVQCRIELGAGDAAALGSFKKQAPHGHGHEKTRKLVSIFVVISLVVTISRKSFEIVATGCHILKLKCTKFDFGWGSTPKPHWGSLQRSPDP